MLIHSFRPRPRASSFRATPFAFRSRAFWPLALFLGAALLWLPAAQAQAAPEGIQEVIQLEAEGQKFDAYMKLTELAPRGDAEAQYRLAGYYHYGYASAANFQLALDWYERAARQGHTDAMLGIAILNAQDDISIPLNKPRAFTWLTIAAARITDEDARGKVERLRDKLKSELSSAELSAALAEAMAFQPVPEQQQ